MMKKQKYPPLRPSPQRGAAIGDFFERVKMKKKHFTTKTLRAQRYTKKNYFLDSILL
jgi:hypothetical protein